MNEPEILVGKLLPAVGGSNGAGADFDVEVVVFGTPYGRARCVFADVQIVVVIAFVAGIEVKDSGA